MLTRSEKKNIKKDLKYRRLYRKYIEHDNTDYFFVIVIFTIIWVVFG